MPENKGLTDGEVHRQVQQLVAQGRIVWLPHVEDQMARRGYNRDQIKECLCKGYFSERPHIANRPGEVEYAFRMRATVEGDPIAVGASLVPDTRVIVITVFEPTSWS